MTTNSRPLPTPAASPSEGRAGFVDRMRPSNKGKLGMAAIAATGVLGLTSVVAEGVQTSNEGLIDPIAKEAVAEHQAAVAAFNTLLGDPDGEIKYGKITLRAKNSGVTIVRTDPSVPLNIRRGAPPFRQDSLDTWNRLPIWKQVGNPNDPDKKFANASGVTLSRVLEITYPDGDQVTGGFPDDQNSFPNGKVTGEDLATKTIWIATGKFKNAPDAYGAEVVESPDTGPTHIEVNDDGMLVTTRGDEVGQFALVE